MSRYKKWTDQELMQLGNLIEAGLTNPEISDIMKKPRAGVQIKAQRIWGGNPNYMKQKTKHKHLREPVMRYFLNHTWEETMKKFKLTHSELKSLFTVGYRDPDLNHLRKETRRHDAWSPKEYQFLIANSGIMPRDWIGKKLKRGTSICIKERLQKLGLSSKNLNGLTLTQFRSAFGCDPKRYVQTKAGPKTMLYATHFKIITWTDLDNWIESGELCAPDVTRLHVSIMAMFQRWIQKGIKIKFKYNNGGQHGERKRQRNKFHKRDARQNKSLHKRKISRDLGANAKGQ